MNKKVTAKISLFLAGIVLLVFAVFPHHHHADYICFNLAHCSQSAETTHHCSHEHDSHSDEEGCIQYLFQTQVERTLSISHSDNCQDGHCHHFTFLLSTLTGFLNGVLLDSVTDKYPDIRDEALPNVLYAADLSGRAPPCV